MFIVNLYGIIQFAIGIENCAVAGITYTLGQDFTDKAIGFHADGTVEKIPSTYQSGGSLGIFNVLGVSFLLSSYQDSAIWKYMRYVALGLGLVGVMLSGSRSIQIPFFLLLIIFLIQFVKQLPPRKRSMTLGIGGVALAIGAACLYAQQTIVGHFFDRLVNQTLADKTASGRTEQWSQSFEVISQMNGWQLLRQIMFGQNPHTNVGGEGLPKFFFMFGIVSTIAFYGGLIYIIRHCWQCRRGRIVALGILCVFCAFCVDQSFYYPPNIMNISLFAAAVLKKPSFAKSNERIPQNTAFRSSASN